MPTTEQLAMLEPTQRRGSRARCVLLTHADEATVARRLCELADHQVAVETLRHAWLPHGFALPQEAKLGDTAGFVSAKRRETLLKWWLARPIGANLPNWDIASSATVASREGLLLVEAKAHTGELKAEDAAGGIPDNARQIRTAIAEANTGLNRVLPGWNLTAESHYQLCNRFAWAWKIALLGVPVVLVYLGFLNANEMADRGAAFRSHDEWVNAVLAYGRGIVPETVWEHPLDINSTPLRAMLRSMTLAM